MIKPSSPILAGRISEETLTRVEPGYPDDVLAGDPNRNFDERALAYVVRDILDLAGLKFDVEGRLL